MPQSGASTTTLPRRAGPSPRATSRAPHIQLDQLAPAAMHAALMARVYSLPDVEERPGTVADPRESAIWLRDDLPAGPADAFLGNREIGHFHPWDRSLHIALPPELAVAIVDSVNLTRYLEIRSVARLVPDSEAELTDRLAKKYLGLDRFPYLQPGEERVQVVVAARHATNQ